MCAFGRGDQLNHLFRAAEPVLDAICVRSKGLHRQLRGDACIRESRVFRNESNLVDPDSGRAALPKVLFETICQGAGPGARLHEHSHEIGKLLAFDARVEADARDARVVEQIGKAALGVSGFERHAIQQKLRPGGSQQKAGFAGCSDRVLKFIPRGLELAGRTRVL
jgi:hypothetical protein